MLPDSYTLTLDRDRSARHDLRSTEYRALVQWLAQGALASPEPASSAGATAQIKQWETFLNGTSGKQQLVSRYIDEHLFIFTCTYPFRRHTGTRVFPAGAIHDPDWTAGKRNSHGSPL